jgi:hypothetical protein
MIKSIWYLVILLLTSCSNSESNNSESSPKKEPGTAGLSYQKSDLKKIKWIEGKWKGLYNGQPFYEIYQLINDSTLVVTTFDWNGKDSSKTEKTYLGWYGDGYYLGKEKNYKVTTITDSQILMAPNNKASNSVLWKYRTDSSWDAILEGPKATHKYLMEKFDWKSLILLQ